MFEKVNKFHPDKIADRIAGAIVDLAYSEKENPKVAVEVMLGHGNCKIITESNINFADEEHKNKVFDIVQRICEVDGIIKSIATEIISVKQDEHLSQNQNGKMRCGDNGIFKGVPTNDEETILTEIAKGFDEDFKSDGKYVIAGSQLIICQSGTNENDEYKSTQFIKDTIGCYGEFDLSINPLGEWTGGIDVDTGATNRKLGSDMGRAVTGGGLHGKDLSKADVSVNIWAYLYAQELKSEINAYCAIGSNEVYYTVENERRKPKNKIRFEKCVFIARDYIQSVGGFEKFAEWGLI